MSLSITWEGSMATKMTHTARAELTNAVRRRHGAATGAEKRKILDEFIAVTGYREKSAIRALNADPIVKARRTRVRPSAVWRGGAGGSDRALGGLRPGMRQAPAGVAADPAAGLGAQRPFACC